ncbi:MAG: PqqD family peptide modification chaperone [Anaerolineaceae bacterium]|nr:PqqD family peptide modification chaperone [Anaerolineaceae bacterium]
MFNKIEQFFDSLFTAVQPVPAGIYQYQAPADAPLPYKWHLRIEADGTGLLVLNASTVLHINNTAAEYAYYLAQGKKKAEIVQRVVERYDVEKAQAEKDLDEFIEKVTLLIESEDLDPVTYLDMERVTPHTKKLSAPLRIDCALTYKVSPGTESAVAPNERVTRELTTREWETILEAVWNAGVPHVVFTGGEPTLRADLPDLISKTEQIGLVSGLLTDGLKLVDKKYLATLLNSGLDHIMLLANETSKDFWKALKLLMPADIAVTVHVTLTESNQADFIAFLDKLAKEGVTSISLSAEEESLSKQLEEASQKTAELGMRLVWDLPVPYSSSHPLALEQRESGNHMAEGAGKTWLYVEPDGDVLPAQGINRVMGNILRDPWSKIWKRR